MLIQDAVTLILKKNMCVEIDPDGEKLMQKKANQIIHLLDVRHIYINLNGKRYT